ncbi:hypothetical protein SSPO_097030 [Streptomyces antimycoticus]|uniref:HTH luxR-type domain-containing protein n=1 Tax=Streptomyces antimycoticus TaxID=68175 RepID=A0A499UXQ9_9ACTN|nr:hypothetical protein [Streptomyces antimycoticus]BBJ46985.1 hypothetical protein SSPO_097030 [Streptomyces antimycoticus]
MVSINGGRKRLVTGVFQIAERMLLSHRTIGTHLYQIYPKPGITSRAALRDALSGLDLHAEED